jgi:holin-like protein
MVMLGGGIRAAPGIGRTAVIAGLATLIGCQWLGELLRRGLHLPIPGPVIGMFLLAAVLVAANRGRAETAVSAGLTQTAGILIRHMGLLFVPAGVGVIAESSLLRQQWLPIIAALIGSTLLGVAVTGLVMFRVSRRLEKCAAPPAAGAAGPWFCGRGARP